MPESAGLIKGFGRWTLQLWDHRLARILCLCNRLRKRGMPTPQLARRSQLRDIAALRELARIAGGADIAHVDVMDPTISSPNLSWGLPSRRLSSSRRSPGRRTSLIRDLIAGRHRYGGSVVGRHLHAGRSSALSARLHHIGARRPGSEARLSRGHPQQFDDSHHLTVEPVSAASPSLSR